MLADSRYGWEPDEKIRRIAIGVRSTCWRERNLRLPLFEAFDQPDMLNSCPRRTATTTAPQALEMLNSDDDRATARQWSGKLLAECGSEETALVRAGV